MRTRRLLHQRFEERLRVVERCQAPHALRVQPPDCTDVLVAPSHLQPELLSPVAGRRPGLARQPAEHVLRRLGQAAFESDVLVDGREAGYDRPGRSEVDHSHFARRGLRLHRSEKPIHRLLVVSEDAAADAVRHTDEQPSGEQTPDVEHRHDADNALTARGTPGRPILVVERVLRPPSRPRVEVEEAAVSGDRERRSPMHPSLTSGRLVIRCRGDDSTPASAYTRRFRRIRDAGRRLLLGRDGRVADAGCGFPGRVPDRVRHWTCLDKHLRAIRATCSLGAGRASRMIRRTGTCPSLKTGTSSHECGLVTGRASGPRTRRMQLSVATFAS